MTKLHMYFNQRLFVIASYIIIRQLQVQATAMLYREFKAFLNND